MDRPVGGWQFWSGMFISVFGQFCVPVFLAISGAVLLNREDEPVKKQIMRVIKMFMTLVVFSFAYYLKDAVKFEEVVFSWRFFLEQLYSNNLKYHLWYLYQYLFFLLTIPLLRPMVRNLPDRYFGYLAGLALLMNGVIPCAEYILFKGTVSLSSYKNTLWIVNSIVIFPAAGYYIHARADEDKLRKYLPWIWLMNILGICVSCIMTYYFGKEAGGFDESVAHQFDACFVLLNCIALFASSKVMFEKTELSQTVRKFLISSGECTFGIYLLHVFFLQSDKYFEYLDKMGNLGINNMISAWISVFLIYIFSFVITLIISKIPAVRKLVGFM